MDETRTLEQSYAALKGVGADEILRICEIGEAHPERLTHDELTILAAYVVVHGASVQN